MKTWNDIIKEYNSICKKLGYSDYIQKPIPIDKCSWNIFLSSRSMGKTSEWLIIGLIAFKYNNVVTHYVRQNSDMIAPKLTRTLYQTITDLGYIKAIFNGKYDGVLYNAGRFYLVKYAENGTIEEKSDYFCMLMAVDKWDYYKSSYNCPTGDLIIFDEFIGRSYNYNEFINFSQIISTVFRHRLSGRIIMLANTINKYSQYFKELCISDEIMQYALGDSFTKTIEDTTIYCELMGERVAKIKHLFNMFIFGFAKNNSRLTSITGECGTWDALIFPHLPAKLKNVKIYINNYYIFRNNKILKCRIQYADDIGLHANIFLISEMPDKSDIVILSENAPQTPHDEYGHGDLVKIFSYLLKKNKIYFSTNESGLLFREYVNAIKSNNLLK